MPQRGSLLPYRGVLSFLSKAREASGSEAARLHHARWRRRGRLVARGIGRSLIRSRRLRPGLRARWGLSNRMNKHGAAYLGFAMATLLAVGVVLSTFKGLSIWPFGFDALHRVADTEGIGVATMMPDGTIVLRLRATGPGGMVGDGVLTYPPSDSHYAEILQHLGGMNPGETKSVRPWPDK